MSFTGNVIEQDTFRFERGKRHKNDWIEKPRITKIDEEDRDYGKFVVEPWKEVMELLGNSLRRILTFFLPGAAITNIQIDGVLHEFQPSKV